MATEQAGNWPQNITRYIESERRIKGWQHHEPAQLRPSGRTQLLAHGYPTERAAVMFHGFTNAPQQFAAFGRLLFEAGYNVLLPRAPHHGLPDQLTTDHARLTVDELREAAERAVDVAAGLGERLMVMGLSMGGVMTAWLAQHHREIDLAVIIAPALAFRAVPLRLTRLVGEAALRVPNIMRWWDPALKANTPGPAHMYQRYATHGLAHILRLGREVQAAAVRSAPAARQVLVVTNANDEDVDNRGAERLVAAWRAVGADNVRTFEFPRSDGLRHDLIDPQQPQQRATYVYDVLLDLIERR